MAKATGNEKTLNQGNETEQGAGNEKTLKNTRTFKNNKTGVTWEISNPDQIARLEKDSDYEEVK